jgi:hypothetical protein
MPKMFQKLAIPTLFFICVSITSMLFASNDPRLTMDSNGNIAAAWLAYVEGGTVIKATTKLQSGNWTLPQVISSVKSNTSDPKIYALANLTDISVVVLWTEESDNGIIALYAAMLPSSTGSWTAPVAISGSDENVNSPQFDLVIDSAGNSTAVWVSSVLGTTWISAATSVGFTNSWSAPLSQQP